VQNELNRTHRVQNELNRTHRMQHELNQTHRMQNELNQTQRMAQAGIAQIEPVLPPSCAGLTRASIFLRNEDGLPGQARQ
jgi:hypothetical protein